MAYYDDEDKKKGSEGGSSSGGSSSGKSSSSSKKPDPKGGKSADYGGYVRYDYSGSAKPTTSGGSSGQYSGVTVHYSPSEQKTYTGTWRGTRSGGTGSAGSMPTRGSSAYNQQQQYNATQPANATQRNAQSKATQFGLQGVSGIGQRPDVTADGKWYAGEKPTDIEAMARIVALNGGDEMKNNLLQERWNPDGDFYRAYSGITSEAVGHLAALGVDVPANGLPDDWFDKNLPLLAPYYKPGKNSTTGAPTLGKHASKEEQIAYWAYQAAQQRDNTNKAETELAALKEELAYKAGSDKNYSDDYIINNIDWSNYPTLQKMTNDARDGVPVGLVRYVDWDRDYLEGMVWAARNGGGTGDSFSDSVNALLGYGNGYEWDEKVAEKLDPGSENYSPFSVGATADKLGQYFGVYSFDDQWFEDNAYYKASSDPTQRKMYADAYNAHQFTKTCRDERDKLYAAIDEQLGWNIDLSDKDALDELLSSSEYRNLARLDKSMASGDLEETTGPIDYSRKGVEDYIAAKMAEKEAERTAAQKAKEDRSLLNGAKRFFGGIAENIGKIFNPGPAEVGAEGHEPVYDENGNEVRPEPSKSGTVTSRLAGEWGPQTAAAGASDAGSLIPRNTPAPPTVGEGEERPAYNREEPSSGGQRPAPTAAPLQPPPQAQEDIDEGRRKNVANSGGIIKDFGNESDKAAWHFSTVNAQGNVAEIRRGIDEGTMTAGDGAKYLTGAADTYAAANYYGAAQTTREYNDLTARLQRAETELAGMQEPPELLTVDELEARMVQAEGVMNNSYASVEMREDARNQYDNYNARLNALMRSNQDMEGTPEEQRARQNYDALTEAVTRGHAQLSAMQSDYDAAQKTLGEVDKYYRHADEFAALSGQKETTQFRTTDVIDAIMDVAQAPAPDWNPWSVYDIAANGGSSDKEILAFANQQKAASIKMAGDLEKLLQLADESGMNLPPEVRDNLIEKIRQEEWNAKDTDLWSVRLQPDFDERVARMKKRMGGIADVSNLGRLMLDTIANPGSGSNASAAERYYGWMEYLTDTERDSMLYLWDEAAEQGGDEAGYNAAQAYYDHLADPTYGRVHARQSEEYAQAAQDFASQSGATATLAAFGAAVLSPLNSLNVVDIIADRAMGRRHNPFSGASALMRAGQEAQGVMKEKAQNYFAGGPDTPGGQVIGFLIDAGLSAVSSAANAAVAGAAGINNLLPGSGLISKALNSGISSANMAAAAFSSTYNDVIQNGGSDDQALAMAAISFLAEDVTEAIEFTDIMDAFHMSLEAGEEGAKTFAKFISSQIPELSNEVIGEALGQYFEGIGDRAIMGDDSEVEQNVQRYMAALKEADPDLSDEAARAEAEQYAAGDFLTQIMLAGAAGGVSAGMSTTVGYGFGRIGRRIAIHNRTKELQKSMGVSKDKAREIATYEVTGEVNTNNAEAVVETPAEPAVPTQPEMPAAPAAVRNAEAMGIRPREYAPRTSTQMANDLANAQKRSEEPVSPARADTGELTEEEIEAAPDETMDIIESGPEAEGQPEVNPVEAMETVNRGPAPLAPIQGPLQQTVPEEQPSPYQLGTPTPKATIRVLPANQVDRLGRTFVSLSDAIGASPQVQGIALAAALDEDTTGADNLTTGEAMAASQALAETLGGDDAIDFVTDTMLLAASEGVDDQTIKSAIRTAALIEGEGRDIIRQIHDTMLTSDKISELIDATARDLQDPLKLAALRKRVMDAQVSQRTQEIVGDGALESTKPAQKKVKKSRSKLRRAVAGLEAANAKVEAAQENLRDASENMLSDADGRSDDGKFNGKPAKTSVALNQLEVAIDGQQRAEQAHEEAEAENREAEKEYESVSTREMNRIRQQAMADVAAENQKAEQLRQRRAEAQAARESAVSGKEGRTYVDASAPIQFHYAVVPVNGLIVSNDTEGNVNPEYPAELQPRDRTRTDSRLITDQRARTLNPDFLGSDTTVKGGAPIVGPDFVVESGNGRAMAIRQAMEQQLEGAGVYFNWLREHAADFGLDPAAIHPDSVLVRVRDTDVDRADFARRSNVSETSAMSATEQAQSDADTMTYQLLNLYNTDADSMSSAGNRNFVQGFLHTIPETERGMYIQEDGNPSQSLLTRARNALFQAAFGSQRLTSALAESTDEVVRNVTAALTNAAPRLAIYNRAAQNGDRYDLGIGDIISQAAEKYRSLRANGQTVDEWLNQINMFGDVSNAAKTVMQMFEANSRSGKKITRFLTDLATRAESLGDPKQTTLDGMEIPAPNVDEFVADSFAATQQGIDNDSGKGQTTLFDANTLETEAAALADEYIERHDITNEEDRQAVRDAALAQVEQRAQRDNTSALDTDAMRARRAEIEAINKELARRIGDRIGMRIEYVENVPYNGRIVTSKDGKATIQINNALAGDGENAFRRVLLHELTHHTEQTGLYNDLQSFLLYRAYGTNATLLEMNQKKGVLAQTDANLNRDIQAKIAQYAAAGIDLTTNEALQEITADLTYDMLYGQDENLVYSLAAEKPGLIQNIIQHISDLIGKLTGHGNVDELQRMRDRFQKALDQAGQSRGQQNTQFSLQQFPDGTRYVEVDTDQDFFDSIDEKDMPKELQKYIINRYRGTIVGTENRAYVDRKAAEEYAHPAKRVEPDIYNEKARAAAELNAMMDAAQNKRHEDTEPGKHPEALGGFDHYDVVFHRGDHYYQGDLNIMLLDANGNRRRFHDITKIRDVTEAMRGRNAPLSDDISSEQTLPQTNQPVNSQQKFSLPEIKTVDGEDAIEQVPGAVVKYSFSSWNADEQARVMQALTNTGEFTPEQVQKWISDVNSIAAMIGADRARLDYKAAENQKFLKDNAEYVKTLDSSTLCAKRRLYQGTFDAIQKLLPNTVISSDLLIHLRNMMADRGYETPCGICYVESRRRNLGAFTDRFLKSYNGDSTGYMPTMADLTTTDGLEALRTEHPEAYEAYRAAMAKTGSNNPKVVQPRTDYRGEIIQLTPGQVQKIIEIGGLRVQSFSDFETPHLIDMMQAVLDMAARGLTSQAYTKVPNFAAVFGGTGIKINLSLIAEGTGLDENGNLIYSSYEGMDIKRALELRDQYADNVGTILVGVSDAHILAAMASDDIDFIIPFHKSGWGKKQLEQLTAMRGYHDYTADQNERRVVGKTAKGRPKIKKVDENFHPVDYWDYSKSGKENAEVYLRMCAEDGRIPKFARFLVNNGDGSYSLQPDGSTDGYWKLLGDFKMYNHKTGKGVPQRAVTPIFNMKEAQRVLNEYEGGADTLPVAPDVVKDFVEEYKGEHPRAKYSLPAEVQERDTNYQQAVESNDTEAAQQLVHEAASEAGFVGARYSLPGELGQEYREALDANDPDWQRQVVDTAARNAGYDTNAYHGSNVSDITTFNTRSTEEKKQRLQLLFGTHFTQNKSFADIYAKKAKNSKGTSRLTGKTGRVYDVYLDLGNSLDLRTARNYTPDTEMFQLYNDLPQKIRNRHKPYVFSETDTREGLGSGEYITARIVEEALQDMSPKDATEFLTSHGYNSLLYNANYNAGMANNRFGYDPSIIMLDSERIKSGEPITRDDAGNIIPLSERFNHSSQDIRYSLPAQTSIAEMDDAYESAYNEYDDEAGERLVAQAAERSMPNSVVRNDDGSLKVVYHQTNADPFTVFDMDKARTSMDIQGAFFAPENDPNHEYGDRAYAVYLDIKNPAYNPQIDLTRDNGGARKRQELIEQGYDGVINTEDGKPYEYVAFFPEQIKSAEAFVEDDDGDLIPLSARFNSYEQDIRYALPANMSEELGLMAEQRIRERQENTAAREQAALQAQAVSEAARKVRLYERKRGPKLSKEGLFSNIWDDTNPLEKITDEMARQNAEEIKRIKAKQAAGETLTEDEQALLRAGARGAIRSTQDPREMVRHKRNVVNNYMTACLEDGMVNTQGERVMRADGTAYGSLNDITNGRVEMHEEQEFNQFLFDLYSIERNAYGTPITTEDMESIQRRVAATMAKHGDWMQVADDIADWYGTFVYEWVVKPGGLMSEDAYQAMRAAYPHYIPMIGTGEDLVLPRALQHEQSERQRVARLKRAGQTMGTEVMNPMYAIVSQMQKYMETEKQAEVMRAADAAFSNNGIQALGWAELVEEPAPRQNQQSQQQNQQQRTNPIMEAESTFQWVTLDDDGNSVLHVPMPDGSVRHWKCYDMGMVDALTRDQAGNRLMNAINNTPVVGEVVRFLSSLTRFLCANSTSRDIRFSGQNFISDGHTAMITGNTHGNLITYNLERLGTLAWLMNQHRLEKHGGQIDERYRQYKLQANMGSAFRLRDDFTQRNIRKGMYGKDTTREGRRQTSAQHWQEVGTIGGLFEIISKTLNIVPGRISNLSDLLEETTRVNEWLKGGHDLSTYDGRIAAARASREATTDFSLSGSNEALALYGKFVPFARAQMQGVYKTVQTLTGKDSAAKSKVMRRLVFNTLASAIVGGILREISWDDDEKEAYEEMSAYEKMKYYHLKIPGIGLLKLKRSQDALIQMANAVGETIADLSNGYEDNDFGQLWDFGMDIASNMLPSRDFVFNPFIDAANNRTWYGGSIESAKFSGRAETDKYEADTLGVFRGMSQFCNAVPGLPNYSPLDCEYIFQQYLGSAGRIMVGELQNVASEDGFTAQDLLMTAWDQIGGKLTYDPVYSSYASNTFYEGMDQLGAVVDMDKAGAFECGYLRKLSQAEFKGAAREAKRLQEGTLGSIRKQISKLWKAYNSVSDNKSMPRDEREASLRTIRDSINRLSVQGNSIIAEYMRKYGRRSIRQAIADGVLDLID